MEYQLRLTRYASLKTNTNKTRRLVRLKIGNKQCVSADQMKTEELELLVNRIVAMGKVLYGLHVVSIFIFIHEKNSKFLI